MALFSWKGCAASQSKHGGCPNLLPEEEGAGSQSQSGWLRNALAFGFVFAAQRGTVQLFSGDLVAQ